MWENKNWSERNAHFAGEKKLAKSLHVSTPDPDCNRSSIGRFERMEFAANTHCSEAFSRPNPIERWCFVRSLESRLQARCSSPDALRATLQRIFSELPVRSGNSVGAVHHFTGHGHELFQPRARNDDRITTTMCFLRDTHEAASFVFSKFYVEVLTFDLKFFRDNYVIHDDLEGCRLET
jgi:hypothetical protein